MTQPTFPPEIRQLPRFDGPITAHRLAADCGDVLFASYPAGTTIPPHQHATHNVGVVLTGRLHLAVDGAETTFDPGCWYRLPANTEHAARFDRHTELVEIWFTADPEREPAPAG